MKSKFFKVFMATMVMTMVMAGTVLASSWVQFGDDYSILKNNGDYVYDAFVTMGDYEYYIDDNGYLVRDALLETGDGYRYVNQDGVIIWSAWVPIYDEDGNITWYYMNSRGYAYHNVKKEIDGYTYKFDDEGKMVTGYLDENEEVLENTENVFMEAMYYYDENGRMLKNQWLLYEHVGESDEDSLLAQRNYYDYDEMWLYFGHNGKKIKATENATYTKYSQKSKTINGKTYLFDEYGVMIPQFSVTTATRSSAASSYTDATIATHSNATIKYASADIDGAVQKNQWIYGVPNEHMDEDAYNDLSASWFRTNSSGNVYKNTIREINGKKYIFDKLGRMKTGLVIMTRVEGRTAQYEYKGTLSVDGKQDFINWEPSFITTTTTNSDGTETVTETVIDRLYFTSTDYMNDGSVRSGGDYKYETENDGTITIGVKSNGVVRGLGALEKYNNKYYYNGLLLQADEYLNYGLVKVTLEDGSYYYVVVNESGRIQTGTKVVKDGDDGYIMIQNGKFVTRVETENKPKFVDGVAKYSDGTTITGAWDDVDGLVLNKPSK